MINTKLYLNSQLHYVHIIGFKSTKPQNSSLHDSREITCSLLDRLIIVLIPEESHVYKDVRSKKTYDPGWGRILSPPTCAINI
jgi:hypothetical protein